MVTFNGVNHLPWPRAIWTIPSVSGATCRVCASWPGVRKATPVTERVVYDGAGSELFHGKKVL